MARLFTLTVQNKWNAQQRLNLQFQSFAKRADTIAYLHTHRPDVVCTNPYDPATKVYTNVNDAVECVDAFFRK